ncbi:MAG: hypothetical protein E7620_00090 [Ruminococcaceae bacterium]|nr:hypothetical protein [Oscillospiraceae bacterium]
MKKRFLILTLVLLLSVLAFSACDKEAGGSGALGGLLGGAPVTPQNLRYDGTLITWNASEGAEAYLVQINDGEEWTVTVPQYAYDAAGGQFTFKVTAVADANAKKPKKSEPATMNFKPLGNIGELRVADDGSVSWDVVSMATAYVVKIDGVQTAHVLPTPTFTEVPVGRHSIQIRPVINGDDSYYSKWSNPVSFEVLQPVSKDTITYDPSGYIKWGAVGAQFYDVYVNGNLIADNCNSTQVSYDPLNANFEVTIQAIGNHSSTYDAKISDAKKFVFLDSVTNIVVEDGILKWDPVNGANGYRLRLNGTELNETFTTCEFNRLTANTNTRVEIRAISNDDTYFSSWSAEKNVLLLPAPTLRWNEYELDGQANSNIYWDTVAQAAGYAIRITRPNGVTEVLTYGETQRFFQEAYLESGTYIVEAKALANTTTSNVYDSIYSTPIKVIRLDAPKPAKSNPLTSNPNDLDDGFVVTFEKVAGATSYKLFQDNVLNQTISSTQGQFSVKNFSDPGRIEEQTYNFKIQSVGSVQTVNGQIVATLSSLSANSYAFEVTVLATPAQPTISGYQYSYGSVSRAFGYVVDVGGQSFVSGETFYNLDMLAAGNYSVSVCAQGNGTNVLPSNYSAPITVYRLDAPANVRIDTTEASEGILTFDDVLYAQSYEVFFNNDGNALPVSSIQNMNQYITEQGTTVHMKSVANYYNSDGTIYYMSSQPGSTTNFIKLAKPTFGDVAFTNDNLIWKAPGNVDSSVYTPTYEVYYPNGMIYNGEKNGTSFSLATLEGGQSYEFQVKAIGNGTKYINSEKSITVAIYKLATPKVERENGKYVFKRVTNAVSYAVYVDGELVATYQHNSDITSYEYTPLFKELKTYMVEVVAIGDQGYTSINSNPCVIEQETKQLQTPDFKLSYSEESYSPSGQVIATITKESPYAKEYAYDIGGTTYTSAALSQGKTVSTAGKITVRVYAIGGNFDENGVYYIDSQSQGGNDRYSIIILASPNPSDFKFSMDGSISWTPISGTSKYRVTIVCGNVSKTVEVTSTTLDLLNYEEFEDVNMKSDHIEITVQAIGNGMTTVTSEAATAVWN